MDETDSNPTADLTAQDFGFVLAGTIAAMYRLGVRVGWDDAYIDQNFDELLTTAQVLAASPQLQEQIVADAEIVTELAELHRQLVGNEHTDMEAASYTTRRLWRSVKPYSR